MSKENVKKFYEELTNNKELQKKVAELSKKYEGEKPTEDIIMAETVSLAKAVGFKLTVEEVKEYIDGQKRQSLTDDELDAATGGNYYPESRSEEEQEHYDAWNTCMCIFGGGGKNKKEGITCACVLGGGGLKDSNGICFVCVAAGMLTK